MLIVSIVIVVSLILITIAGECKNNRFPTTGKWSDDPPYWTPEGCNVTDFTSQSVSQCLGNRTVYAVGSSIARQFPFLIAHVLGATLLNRTEQLVKCDHHATSWDGCVDEIMGVKFRYMFLQYIDGFDYSNRGGFKFIMSRNSTDSTEDGTDTRSLHKALYLKSFEVHPENAVRCPPEVSVCSPQQVQKWPTPYDGCWHLDAFECLKPLFKDAKASDILILSIGVSYGLNMYDGSDVDYDAWISASARKFQRAVNALFPGRVFRVTNSPVQDKMKPHTQFNSFLRRSEETFVKSFDVGVGKLHERPWFTVDQWSINEHHLDLYNDYVHFQGALTKASLNNILSEYCASVL